MNELIVICAKYLYIVSILLFIACGFKQATNTKKRLAFVTLVGGILALILAKISGHFVYDARPFVSDHVTPLIAHASDNGFPSDHTLLTSFLAFAVWTISRRLSLALAAIALFVGSTRVAAGIHHPLDIFGSFAISAVAVLIVNHLWTRWQHKSARNDA